jgi:hypothetical protein
MLNSLSKQNERTHEIHLLVSYLFVDGVNFILLLPDLIFESGPLLMLHVLALLQLFHHGLQLLLAVLQLVLGSLSLAKLVLKFADLKERLKVKL